MKVLITDCDHGTIEPELSLLTEAGFQIELLQSRDPARLIEAGHDADALIVQYAQIDAAVLASLNVCRIIVRYGVGYDSIDADAAAELGIWVANVPDYGIEEVSDHAAALTLNWCRRINVLESSVRSGEWDFRVAGPLRRIRELTIGVVGCGRIGSAFARKMSGFGCRVIATDPNGIDPDALARGVAQVDLTTLLMESDVVSLHVPLTSETQNLMGPAELANMKPGSYLVNTARGGVVDEAALVAALDSRHLAGVALDVLAHEPPSAAAQRLLAHPHATVTPHIAWYSEDSFMELKSKVAQEVVRVLRDGQGPLSPVNSPVIGRVSA